MATTYANKKRWNYDELHYLIENHNSMTNKQISINLGRSKNSIDHKLNRLNYHKLKNAVNKFISISNKGRKLSKEHKYKISCALKGENNPAKRPEVKEKIRSTVIKLWQEGILNLSGEKNPNWKGGTSRLPYSYDWKKIRNLILERDNYTCQKCKKNKSELELPLCVHHKDHNRINNDSFNLVSLCWNCHARTNNLMGDTI